LRYTYPISQATAITLLDVISFTRQAKKNGENADLSDEAAFDDRVMATGGEAGQRRKRRKQ
jgi:hypothetical protein